MVEVGGGAIEEAFTYHAEPAFIDPTLLPFQWYRDMVAAGARQHGLPDSYVERILQIPVRPDPDRMRAERHRALL